MPDVPTFTMGIEEEYLLVDAETFDLVAAPEGLMEEARAEMGDQVSPEFLQCQIEVGTGVCSSIAEARADLGGLRRAVARVAAGHGLRPLAASTHPFARWKAQSFSEGERYRDLERDLGGVARRMLICGMHVHVGIEDDDRRIDLMDQLSFYLPHLLALSASSPFWEGRETELCSYRLTVFDNMPRTGLPPRFDSHGEYRRSVEVLVDCGVIEDTSKIWWDLRPSHSYPTLESRICDVSPRLDDAIAIAALTRSLLRMLWSLEQDNQRLRRYDRFLIEENRWQAQRHGVEAELIDFGRGTRRPFVDVISELVDRVRPHAVALGCEAEVERVNAIARDGNSATRQRATLLRAMEEGADRDTALREVVRGLLDEFEEGLP